MLMFNVPKNLCSPISHLSPQHEFKVTVILERNVCRFVASRNQLFVQTILNCVVSLRLFYCSQSRRCTHNPKS